MSQLIDTAVAAEEVPLAATPERDVQERLWATVDNLIDHSPSQADLHEHRLQLLAARRLRGLGQDVPEYLVAQERLAAMRTLMVAPLLERVRGAYSGPVVLFKGPEVAARYPDPGLRPFGDLDILVGDAAGAFAAMKAAGFEEVGEPELYIDIHHLRPLSLPTLPLSIEIHAEPKWVAGFTPPPTDELLAEAVPSHVSGVLTLKPAHHVLVLTTHAWAHEPLRCLRDLLDVALMAAEVERGEIDALAQRWGIERIWKTTSSAIDALFYGASWPAGLRIWTRNLQRARARTVLESHVARSASPFASLPPRQAFAATRRNFARAARPVHGESWTVKLRRIRRAIAHARTSRAEHNEGLRKEGIPITPREVRRTKP